MVTDELKKYISDSIKSGHEIQNIKQALISVGWQIADIQKACKALGIAEESQNDKRVGKIQISQRTAYAIFTLIIVILSGTIFYLLQDRTDLANKNAQKTREFYAQLAESQISFTDAGDIVFPDEQKLLSQKTEYIQNQKDFVEVDLRTMQLALYEKGQLINTIKILTKGKEKSWWETPTGNYKVLGKSINSFSSIGNVWMPYSIQFYGNYFIHGWPYYENGTPVPQGYSGGCIRLSTEDAKTVFNFVKSGTPILVLEAIGSEDNIGTLIPKITNPSVQVMSAKAFLVSDVASGKIILEKRAEEKLPIASLTKFMTAVVAHEVIYLGRAIKVTKPMLASVSQVFDPVVGERYTGLDLLFPLLMQSSNDAAKILSKSVGDELFIHNMNAKADALQMTDTQFADASGESAQNISTAYDISRLLQYIYYKRPFLFEIGRGIAFENIGLIKIGDTINIPNLKNVNEFVGNPNLIGIKNGKTSAAKETIAIVWNVHTADGDVPVSIVILGSEDRKKDADSLIKWLEDNFAVR